MITVIRIFLRTYKTAKRKPCINKEANRKISKFSYSVTVVERTKKLLAVVIPPSIYHGLSTRKNFWEDNFIPVNTRSCGHHNARKIKEINKGEQYIALKISLDPGFPDKRKFTSSGPRDYAGISGMGMTTSLTLSTTNIPKIKQKAKFAASNFCLQSFVNILE